jgi:integrase/recombinase XerD
VVAVRGLHRFALREGWTVADPAREVRPPVPARRLPKAISVTAVEALLAAPDTDTPLGLRDRALLELLYGTGARISEADRPGRRRPGPGRRAGAPGRQGRQAADRAGRQLRRRAVEDYLVRARPGLVPPGAGTPALFLNARGGRLSRQSAWTVLRSAAAGPASPATSRRTRCGTASRPTCSTAAPTCGSCRSCSATPR